jgi:hypothetical protein
MALGGWQSQLPATTALNPRKDTGWPLELVCTLLNSQFYAIRTVRILTSNTSTNKCTLQNTVHYKH